MAMNGAPTNAIKAKLAAGDRMICCWLGTTSPYVAEMVATTGFDFYVVDGEHAPNDLRSMMEQIRVIEASNSLPAARIPVGESWMVKQ